MPAIDTASRRTVALLLAGALLPLAGCSSASEEDSAGGGASGAAADVRRAARTEVASGGTLRWAVDALPRTYNAFRADADAATDRIAGATLPTLFTLDEQARPQPDPNYVESAEISSREPRQKVVYKLNPKAKWSDGRAIGVKDFKAQWKALNGRNSAFWSSRNAGYDRIGKVAEGKEAYTVEVTFAKPYADWKSLFTPLYPKSVTGSSGAFNESARNSLPVSGGPFKAQKADKDGGTVRLTRNPEWWGERAKLDSIELRAVPRSERKTALAAGKLDLAEIDAAAADRISSARGAVGGPGEASDESGPPAAGGGRNSAVGALAASGSRASSALHEWADARLSGQGREAAAKEREQRNKERAKAAEQRRLRGYTVRKALDPAYTQLALNGASGPLSDERVRRAVARAIDRKELAEQALGHSGLPAEPLGSHLRMRDQDGYQDNSSAIGGKDVESAQSLLADAGWSGDGPPASSGQKVATGEDSKPGGGGKAGETGEDGDDGKPGDAPDGSAAAGKKPGAAGAGGEEASGAQAGPQQPRHRAEVEKAAVPVGAAEAARVVGKPLGVALSSEGQRAALLAQSARVRKAAAKEEGSERKERAAVAELKAAQSLRERADELRLLAGGEATAVRTKGGKPLALRFVLPAGPGSEQARATGRKIAGMLNGVGIRTQIKTVADESYFKDHVESGDYDLALFSWPASAYPATDAQPIFAKPEAQGDGSLSVDQNYTRVGTDQIDQLFEQAKGELDEGARNDLIKRADARIWAAAGSVPLYQRPQLVAAGNKVVNAGAFGFRTPRYQDIGYTR